jgi:hypothetical protein
MYLLAGTLWWWQQGKKDLVELTGKKNFFKVIHEGW